MSGRAQDASREPCCTREDVADCGKRGQILFRRRYKEFSFRIGLRKQQFLGAAETRIQRFDRHDEAQWRQIPVSGAPALNNGMDESGEHAEAQEAKRGRPPRRGDPSERTLECHGNTPPGMRSGVSCMSTCMQFITRSTSRAGRKLMKRAPR